MGLSQLFTALFAVAAIVVAYRLGYMEGSRSTLRHATEERGDPSDLRAYREH